MTATAYQDFLEAKRPTVVPSGPVVGADAVSPILKRHQAAIVSWAVRGGQRGIFARFGLGKTLMQLELGRLVLAQVGGRGLISAPLNCRQEFLRDARKLGLPLTFVRRTEEMAAPGLYLTNHESIREGKVVLDGLSVVSIDEAAILRSLDTKTWWTLSDQVQRVPFRFVATATPAPNDFIEILNYAHLLGVMDIGEAKTRWFRRDAERADHLTLHPHKVEEFWGWVHTWAIFLQHPSELGFDDAGYDLPPVQVRWHPVGVSHADAGEEKNGQGRLLKDAALGVGEAAAARRTSIAERLAKVRALVDEAPDAHVILWHDLEAERKVIEATIPGVRTIYGSQDLEEREGYILDFQEGRIPRLAAKPVMLGAGGNLQRHCHRAIYAGVDFKFYDFIQSVHRLVRFGQGHPVTVDVVYAETQLAVVRKLQRAWKQYDEAMARMSAIIRRHGLASIAPEEQLSRTMFTGRQEHRTARCHLVNNDSVLELAAMEANRFGAIVTSIPFSSQYEYSPLYNDFGHTDDAAHFWRQMDHLTPALLRVLQPGRMLCVHVKDRARPGGYDGRGFTSISPFTAEATLHYPRHGFVYMGMITIGTDVVRENAQTYRLGYSMQCRDGTRMGVGLPEYVLLFRKAPTDQADGFADEAVVRPKEEYSRGRWQVDADGFWRSSGNRLIAPQELVGRPWKEVYHRFREMTATHVYDHEGVVAIADALDRVGQLPPDFKLLPLASLDDAIWADVVRMRTLNGEQARRNRDGHLCPLPFDIVDRLITRFTNPGDEVLDPFAGLGTVPLRAMALGRRGAGVELNAQYFADAVGYCRAHEEAVAIPSLFDTLEPLEAA